MAERWESIESVTLRRGACFGTCPIYEITLRADGSAEWRGDRFVERLGRFHGQANPGDVAKLARLVDRSGLVGWDDEYMGNVTDAPTYELTVVAGRTTKTVRQNATDEPADFWVVAAVVDHFAAEIDWTPGAVTTCGAWRATLNTAGIIPWLTVTGTCTFPTTGYSVELRRHSPPSPDPRVLLLDRIVLAPDVGGDAISEVAVEYREFNVFYSTVTIVPDGVTIPVETVTELPFDDE